MNVSAKKRMRTMGPAALLLALCVTLAGCGGAPHQAGSEAGNTGEATQAAAVDAPFSWTPDANCSLCHATQSASLTDSACQVSANHADVACTQCHSDGSGLSSAHDGVTLADTKGAKKLAKTSVDQDACISCHADAGVPEAAASSAALTDDQGTTVNPHDLPQSESHDTLTCGSCHAMHDKEPLEATASAACTQCHHQNVYECYTCHE